MDIDWTALAQDTGHDLHDEAALREHYLPGPGDTALAKVADHVHPLYQRFIEAAPFAVLATCGPHGLDTSPRGDAPGFLKVLDRHTLLLPDRRGNQRIDSLRNLLHDPHLALLLLIPGCNEALRINGQARISASPALRQALAMDGKPPATVLVIQVTSVYFQCGRAVLRSGLWDPGRHIDRRALPSTGTLLQALSQDRIQAAAYDEALPARQQATLY